jgi:hypothetical protein
MEKRDGRQAYTIFFLPYAEGIWMGKFYRERTLQVCSMIAVFKYCIIPATEWNLKYGNAESRKRNGFKMVADWLSLIFILSRPNFPFFLFSLFW